MTTAQFVYAIAHSLGYALIIGGCIYGINSLVKDA